MVARGPNAHRAIKHYVIIISLPLALLAFSKPSTNCVDLVQGALTGPITISGAITGGDGLPVSGVTVHLDGSRQAVAVTAASGTYSFSGLFPASYSVRPTLAGCSFAPDVVNLNNL